MVERRVADTNDPHSAAQCVAVQVLACAGHGAALGLVGCHSEGVRRAYSAWIFALVITLAQRSISLAT